MNDKRKLKDFSDNEDDGYSRKKKVTKRKSMDKILEETEKAEKFANAIKSDLNTLNSINDIKGALTYFKSIFLRSHYKLPPIIYQHQIYSLVKNRTSVDREIEYLKNSNKIRLFRCDSNTDDIAIVYISDFKQHLDEHLFEFEKENIKQIVTNSKITESEYKKFINKFYDEILNEVKDQSISQCDLKKIYHLSEKEITILVQTGLLTIKDPSSWWFAIPFVGNFRRDLIECRRNIVNVLRKKKFNEITIEELYKRSSKKISKIGVLYIVTDLLGSEVVRKIDSPMGFVVKLT